MCPPVGTLDLHGLGLQLCQKVLGVSAWLGVAFVRVHIMHNFQLDSCRSLEIKHIFKLGSDRQVLTMHNDNQTNTMDN
jgi:hypothetical protein